MKRIFILCLTAFLCLSAYATPKYLIETGEDGDATWSVSIAGATKVNLHDASKTLNEWMNTTFTSNPSSTTDIWLAAGTYTLNGSITAGYSKIRLYGGFQGDETDKNTRRTIGGKAWNMQYPTIIDGANTYSIYAYSSPYFSGTWDGLTFRNGTTTGNGGVARLYGGAKVLACSFLNNTSTGETGKGGALFTYQAGGIQVSDCYFEGNSATQGGAIYINNNNKDQTYTIDHCYFKDNNATLTTNAGGAVYIQGAGTYTIAASVLEHNNASGNGNGTAIFSNGTGDGVYTWISNCLIKNQQNADKYAVYILQGAVLNCTFARNAGGAVYMGGSSTGDYNGRIENNIIWGDTETECKISIRDNAAYTLKNNALGRMITPASVDKADNTTLTKGNTSYFRRPSQGDYHLCAGAAELIAGKGRDLSSDEITTDLDGATRSTYDIGCYIYQIGPDGCSNCFYVCGE